MSRIVVAKDFRPEDPTDGPDRGFTLVELLVSIGIFALLMALVSVFMVTGLSALRDASTANSIQAQQQNAVIEMSRQVRYIDNPVPKGVGQPAILWASPDRMVFFSLSGSGEVDRLAYKVMLCNSELGVESFVWAPTLDAGTASAASTVNIDPDLSVPTCDDAGAAHWTYDIDGSTVTKPVQRRLLVDKDNLSDPRVAFRFFEGVNEIQKIDVNTNSWQETAGGELLELSAEEMDRITRVEVVLTDPSLGAPLEQSVLLVNER